MSDAHDEHDEQTRYIQIAFLLQDSRGQQGDETSAVIARALKIKMTRNKYGSQRSFVTRATKRATKIIQQTMARFASWIKTVYIYVQGNIACRLKARHSFSLIYNWKKLVLRKICKQHFTENCATASQEPIDLVIPTISKDYALLLMV